MISTSLELGAQFKSDQEPAIKSLINALKLEWDGELVPESSPVGDKDGNGSAESAVRTHEGLVRTYKIALERRVGREVPDDSAIMGWIVEWAATLHRRYRIGSDGRTAVQRYRGKTAELAITEFGERVLAQELLGHPNPRNNTEARFVEGIVVGIIEESDEFLVSAASGIIKARTIKRRDPGSQWCGAAVVSLDISPAMFHGYSGDRREAPQCAG